ncbi:MAG: thermonuclease family protein [Candidatus Pacearchaeota archaeon]
MVFLNKNFKIILISTAIVMLFLLIYFLSDLENTNIKEEKIVTKIIDGDTIIIQGGETIRLLGIDCDEKGKECYDDAKKYLEENLLGKTVLTEKESEDKDIYGRYLRYLFLDGDNFNVKIVKEGYCIARIYSETKYKEEIQQAEEYAIKNKIGCKWS